MKQISEFKKYLNENTSFEFSRPVYDDIDDALETLIQVFNDWEVDTMDNFSDEDVQEEGFKTVKEMRLAAAEEFKKYIDSRIGALIVELSKKED